MTEAAEIRTSKRSECNIKSLLDEIQGLVCMTNETILYSNSTTFVVRFSELGNISCNVRDLGFFQAIEVRYVRQGGNVTFTPRV